MAGDWRYYPVTPLDPLSASMVEVLSAESDIVYTQWPPRSYYY